MPLTALPDNQTLVRAVVIAGLVAGLVTSAFHLAVSERYVDRAIAFEEQVRARELQVTGAAEDRHEEVFSRRTQKTGLVAGALIYGVAAGAVVAGIFALLTPHLPGRSRRAQVIAFAAAAVTAAVIVPFIKYPANPPGVGDPATLARRQLLFIGCVALAVAGLWLAVRLGAWLRARTDTARAVGGAVLFYIIWVGALVVLLPSRSDPVHTPSRLVWEFRTASLAGELLFWVAFSALFAVVLECGEQSSRTAVASR